MAYIVSYSVNAPIIVFTYHGVPSKHSRSPITRKMNSSMILYNIQYKSKETIKKADS